MKSFFLGSAALGALLAMSAVPAGAVAVTFTPQFSSPPLAAGETVTFDNITIADFSHIHLNGSLGAIGSTASFSENGFLQITQFLLNGVPQTTPHLNVATTGYALYLEYTATGTNTQVTPTFIDGAFQTLNYELVGVVGDKIAFHVTPTSATVTMPVSSTRIVLGTGSLINDINNLVSLNHGIPSATVDVSFTACTGVFGVCTGDESGFFNGNPVQFIELDGAFTNTRSVILGGIPDIGINGGGGNVTPAPEPVSIAVLGTGLVGIGLTRLRRKSAAV